jgi:hypothetical protein
MGRVERMKELAFEFNGMGECTNIYYIDKDVLKINRSKNQDVPIKVIWVWKHFREAGKKFPYDYNIAWFNIDIIRFFVNELTAEQCRSILIGIFEN